MRIRRITLAVAGALGLLAAGAHAQTAVPRFEAATIKPIRPEGGGEYGLEVLPSGRLKFGAGTLKTLLALALDVEEYQITGGPEWISRDRYDLEAIPPASAGEPGRLHYQLTPREQEMLLALLEERFHLSFKRTTHTGKVYRLVRGPRPLALEPTKYPNNPPNSVVFVRGETADGEMRGRNASIDTIAREIRSYLLRPVIDETGITGRYDYWIKPFIPDNKDVSVAIFGAIDRLGLKLVAAQGTVDAVAIESVSKPTEN